jgi:hypothetical protein
MTSGSAKPSRTHSAASERCAKCGSAVAGSCRDGSDTVTAREPAVVGARCTAPVNFPIRCRILCPNTSPSRLTQTNICTRPLLAGEDISEKSFLKDYRLGDDKAPHRLCGARPIS